MTTNYYLPSAHIHGDHVAFPEDEVRHAVKVLRQRVGDEVTAVDGEGGWYRVRLDEVYKQRVAGRILERREGVGEPDFELTMGLAVLKNPSRFETFVEKAVELGVRQIIPLLTERTEKRSLKSGRLHNLLIAAMKQCGRSMLPVLREPVALAEVLGQRSGQAFLCHEGMGSKSGLLRLLTRNPSEISVLIGPEGGFSDNEVDLARRAGWQVAGLGRRRLRAETAALTAAAVVMNFFETS